MNPELSQLHPYPFEKLAALKADCNPPEALPHIALSIGEPKHPTPGFITESVIAHLHGLSIYPTTAGTPELRQAIANWLDKRFHLAGHLDPMTQVLPVNGTREALFAFAQAVVDRSQSPLVLMPNPFYQIYEGAALLAGAEPMYLNCDADKGFIPDFDAISAETWDRCALIYLCSPGNPTGAVIDQATLTKLIELAHKHNFVIASDECYSEIYFDEANPPVGLLQAAFAAGYTDMSRCVVFHSLSKRSNAPGLRSGFVAGDASILKQFLRYRT
ncbi:MAG: aminotransferase class I/II-fold pyridoxal phosphate-dependent enzyme, partial [Pseudomonadota bacterium]|nr:aminotransferase class I/II-fold pyridoxal phosphate-dependent enzyme [Pseudomonadota bacterium]